jgi:hypothetical protein
MAFAWYKDAQRMRATPRGRVKAVPRGAKATATTATTATPSGKKPVPVTEGYNEDRSSVATVVSAPGAFEVKKPVRVFEHPEPVIVGSVASSTPPPPPPMKKPSAGVAKPAGRTGLLADIEAGRALKQGTKACVDLGADECGKRSDCMFDGRNCRKATKDRDGIAAEIDKRSKAFRPSN